MFNLLSVKEAQFLKEIEFLQESNAIEGVFDQDSLKQAIKAWSYLKKQKEITIPIVLKTHGILMKDHLPKEERGCFRRVGVNIAGRLGLSAPFITEAMEGWCLGASLYPALWKQHHIRFEKIHPFVDGNGRTGRVFLNWMRLRLGLPILVIKESKKFDYYKWFE